jgi:ATP-dependent RNA helicase DDX10/DBP4
LPGAPRVKFLSKEFAKQKKNDSRELQKVLEKEVSEGTSEENSGEEAEEPKKTSVSGSFALIYQRFEPLLGSKDEI